MMSRWANDKVRRPCRSRCGFHVNVGSGKVVAILSRRKSLSGITIAENHSRGDNLHHLRVDTEFSEAFIVSKSAL